MGEWKECTLSDIGTIVGGATPSTKDISNYENGDISWITPKDLSGYDKRYISFGERNITEKGLKSCSTQLMPPNTILFTSRAPIGYVAIAEKELCTNQGFKSIIPNDETDFLFLYYLLKYNKNNIENMGSGTTFKEVSANTMKNIVVKVPTNLDEQKKISSILGSLDDKIEENNKINNNLLEQLFSLYNNLMSTSQDVQEVTLSSLCHFQEGYVNPSQSHPEYFDGDVKWLRAVDINESFIIDTSRTLTQVGFESAKKSALLFKPNTIAISKSGTIGRLGIVADYMCGNRAVINISPNTSEHLAFIYCFLKSKQQEFPDMAVGSVQRNLYVSLLEPLIVLIPSEKKLSDFNSTGTALLNTIQNNCVENIKLSSIRDSLLPKLMSGEIDVSTVNV